jgi:brefeldin A-resistance guanine nucleotide exchange factor 1
MNIEGSDVLAEAVLESLKNMLLVMSTGGIFRPPVAADPVSPLSPLCVLWLMTWERIGTFLPNLHDDLFPPEQKAAELLLL